MTNDTRKPANVEAQAQQSKRMREAFGIPDEGDGVYCQCPRCGRMHKDLRAGTPPAALTAHGAKVRQEALREAAAVADRYAGDRAFPLVARAGAADVAAAIKRLMTEPEASK